MGFERLLHIPPQKDPKKTEVKAIKCLEVHTVKQTEKQYSFIVRRFLVETANFSCKDETANARSSPKHRVQPGCNAILTQS